MYSQDTHDTEPESRLSLVSTYHSFVRGLVALLPLAITLFIFTWLLQVLESTIGKFIKVVLPDGWYVPGMGLVLGVLLALIAGLFLNALVMQQLWRGLDRRLGNLPLVKAVYGSSKDLLGLLAGPSAEHARQVVAVDFGNESRALGLVTREDFSDLPEGLGDDRSLAVYLPLSYQIGGVTLMLPRDRVHPIDMSVENALRFAVMAGVTANSDNAFDRAIGRSHKTPEKQKETTA